MTLTPKDRTAIRDLIHLHGHIVDAGELDRLDELFTPDVVYDITGTGAPAPLQGTDALRQAALALGDDNPVGHHVTNIVLTELGSGRVRALSKGIGVMADGRCASVTYDDLITHGAQGWRISHRTVRARHRPLGAP